MRVKTDVASATGAAVVNGEGKWRPGTWLPADPAFRAWNITRFQAAAEALRETAREHFGRRLARRTFHSAAETGW